MRGTYMKVKKQKRPKRAVPLSDETVTILEQQLEKFRQKFGRDPGPDDPVFFYTEAISRSWWTLSRQRKPSSRP